MLHVQGCAVSLELRLVLVEAGDPIWMTRNKLESLTAARTIAREYWHIS
jgi:hypothetical protein